MKKYISIFIVIVTFLGCNELDSRLSTSIDAEKAIVDIPTLKASVLGSYNSYQSASLYNRGLLVIPELISENSFIDAFDNTGRFLDFDSFDVINTDGDVSDVWVALGRIISQTSYTIRKAREVSVKENELAEKNHLIGEAHALRAFAYHIMQQYFCQPYNFTSDASHLGAPLPDFDLLGGIEIVFPARSTSKEVYNQIVADLNQAASLMSGFTNPNVYRLGLNGVNALLSRVYLSMENWEKADEFADKVLGNYSLMSNGEYVSSWNNDFSSESIFSIYNDDLDNSGTSSMYQLCLIYLDLFATPDFVSTFSTTDVRSNLYPMNTTLNVNTITKYTSRFSNTPVIRLSEMYLIKAEANANITGKEIDAQSALFTIMQRADVNAVMPTETGQALKDRILLERRKELAFEGFRLFDLTRNKKSFVKYRQDAAFINITPGEKTIMPIPAREVNANPNMQQNPGY
ncbi:Starch-binding associating with outer membrane [Tenacibaculum sp. MAR_2009_124]|uniref:RagB/SusD family nutrient uptake outer membrane protein n=1 Tax=Tenacibaculum sp. MAR_2009_124 TaxID=1250059 RepID=UPI00089569E3|nr:RagB/SusD family nutrient uptake outer membrane protein [Tenacibaculum sp. MAR_2009_124]SEB74864.1 Starch-binding associating with outer membrane [Tenacibaculum sp. MAR_2009_124]